MICPMSSIPVLEYPQFMDRISNNTFISILISILKYSIFKLWEVEQSC